MLPFVAMNPPRVTTRTTKDSRYPAIAQRLYENVNDVVLGRQPFSTSTRSPKNGSIMAVLRCAPIREEIAASRVG